MYLNKERIADGISLSTIPSNKFKSGIIAFSLTSPLTRQASAYNHIISGLLRRGTQKYPTMALLNLRLDELYGSYVEIKSNHVGNYLSLTFICEVLDNEYIPDGTDVLSGVIDIIADMMLRPLFMSDSFEDSVFDQEIRIILDALNAEINNTRVYAVKRCAEIMFEDYEEYPTVAETKNISSCATLEDIRAYYSSLLTSAHLEVFYIGSTDEKDISASLRSAFAGSSFGNKNTSCIAKPISRSSFASASESMPVSQGKLAMCFSTGCALSPASDDYYSALMLNEIFGGSASSKLFLNVREKMSLCYYCSSSYSTYSGIMTVSSGIEVKNFELVKNAILSELDKIKNGEISEYEFCAAKRSILNAYRQLYDSPFDLQSFYSGRMMFGIPDTIEDCIEKLSKTTVDDVVRISKAIKLDAMFFVEGTLLSEEEEEENE